MDLYAPIFSCRLGSLSASTLLLLTLGMKSKHASRRTINSNTPAIDIQTTLLVLKAFFDFSECDSTCEDGPSAGFPGDFPGGALVVGTPPKKGVDGDDGGRIVDVELGAAVGVVAELNGFPSFLHIKMMSAERIKGHDKSQQMTTMIQKLAWLMHQ